MEKQFTDSRVALNFIMSGNATVTVVSKRTGKRFTFRVKRPKAKGQAELFDNGFRFVSVMSGPDNQSSYTYMGTISNSKFALGRKSVLKSDTPSVRAFEWMLGQLFGGQIQENQMEIWHEGRCGKCNRKLTVPASIESGIGPECIKTTYRCV